MYLYMYVYVYTYIHICIYKCVNISPDGKYVVTE